MKRWAVNLLEVSLALLVLAALTVLCLRFLAAASDQRRAVFHISPPPRKLPICWNERKPWNGTT